MQLAPDDIDIDLTSKNGIQRSEDRVPRAEDRGQIGRMECGSWKTEPSNWIDGEVASLIEKETFKKRISKEGILSIFIN